MRKLQQQWRDLSFEKKLSIVVVPVALAVVSGVLIPILTRQTEKIGASGGSSSPASKLEVVDLAVSGGVAPKCLRDPENPQLIDLTVRNTGDIPALVKRVVFRVAAYGFIEIPQAGGGLEPSKSYDVLLPPYPRVGQTVTYKVSQKIPPRDVDRFAIRVDVPEPARQEGDRLYQLDVMLLHDTEEKPTEAGKVLVSAPYLPDKGMFWAGVAPRYRPSYEGSGPAITMRVNESEFRRLFSLPGERSPELTLNLVNVPITNKEAANPCVPPGVRGP